MKEVDKKIQNVIGDRTVGVIARGKSAEFLEKNIEKLQDHNLCWTSLNLFTPAEDFILNKIGERLDFISDCSNVANKDEFENKCRRPRFEKFLSRPDNNLLMISNTVIEDYRLTNNLDLLEKYKNKIITIDEVFTDFSFPKEIWEAPPNSITLLFAALIAGQAKKIILFGYDGHAPKAGETHKYANEHAIYTYYKPELEAEERKIATGQKEVGSLATDTRDFNKDFPRIFEMYKRIYNNPNVEIINCSSSSVFTVFRKIDYNQLLGELKR